MLLAPAVGVEEERVDERTRRARKIDPRLAEGELRRAAVARNQAEAEMLQGILLEEGIPSILRRSGGFDVPDFLAAGPRDILVPASGEAAARELLSGDDQPLSADDREEVQRRFALRLAAGMLACLLLFGAFAGLLWALIS